MRLAAVRTGYHLPERLAAAGFATPPDVVKTLLYRPELFGNTFSPLLHAALRGPSDWSEGERELFAAFVSRQNQCPF